ncbi:helix-turn-helix domain-containing protein [Sporolactobacillus sp. KGMB 08714]|uniref:helix-turn-helix domain-containing protein n=1 Tax=Sporolactobacillus sp. KGMB 08714 TaxID=3064704 RepID=UPI002FBD7252
MDPFIELFHSEKSDQEKKSALRSLLQEELINYEGAAHYLGISRTTLRKYIKEKRIQPLIDQPQFQVFLKSDIDAYLQKKGK